MKSSQLNFPFFIFLFPLFFVLHGFTENYSFVSIKSALALGVIYTIVSLLLTGFFYLLSKNPAAASLTAVFILFIQFFFGFIHDFLKKMAGSSFFSRYSFIISLFVILIILLFLLLRKRRDLSRLCRYLNILFLVLILIDSVVLFTKAKGKNASIDLTTNPARDICDSCSRPDIYIIMLDGYAGEEHLKKGFEFDNSIFLGQLSSKGFRVIPNTHSNYLFTPYSIASILNMEYIDSTKINKDRQEGTKNTLKYINNNRLISYLGKKGYRFYNNSIFRVAGQPAPIRSSLVTANSELINENTFLSRFKKDVFPNIAKKWGWKKWLRKSMFSIHKDNETLFDLTIRDISSSSLQPKVVFTHLMMPHDPYYFDKNGRLRSYDELDSIGIRNKQAYLANLKYCNKKIIHLVDNILSKSFRPPVIVLISDHGYRYDYENPVSYAYNNLISIYFPDKNYSSLPDSLTTVNVFPAILNELFHKRTPIRSDSTFTFGF